MATPRKFIPGSDDTADEIFDFPYLVDEKTIEFIHNHGRIMFIIRGLPGTGKNSLKAMLKNQYSTSVICSADDYFSKTFNSGIRTKESLVKSHEYCQKKVEQECKKGSHPIIVSNTHLKIFHVQTYVNFATDFGYTIILSSTLDKFKVNPEILANSNTKGLTKEYFKKILRQWQKFFPICTGWFLSTEDSFFVNKLLQSALISLLKTPKFCRDFEAFDKDEFLESYEIKDILFSVAGYAKHSPVEMNSYFDLHEVKQSYGASHKILLQAFIVTKSDILAVAAVDDDLKQLMSDSAISRTQDDADCNVIPIEKRFRSKYVINSSFENFCLADDFSVETKSCVLEEKKPLNINNSSFMHVARRGGNFLPLCKMMRFYKECLSSYFSSSENLTLETFNETGSGYEIMRLSEGNWLIRPPSDISISSLFTGLYT